MGSDIDLVCGFDEAGILEKGGEADDVDERMMYGYASTPARDADQEQVIQKGLNLEPMLESGWVNYNHDSSNLIGWPTFGDFRPHPKTGKKSLYVEYKLMKGVPMADRIWATAKALKENNAPRSLGLSIEGKKRAVSSKGIILKADVMGFAVCPYPKNPETLTHILTKGFLFPEDDSSPSADLFVPPDRAAEVARVAEVVAKAVMAGHDIGGTTQTGGAATRREDFENEIVYFDLNDLESDLKKERDSRKRRVFALILSDAKKRGNKVTKGEAAFIFSLLGYPLEHCIAVAGS